MCRIKIYIINVNMIYKKYLKMLLKDYFKILILTLLLKKIVF